MDVIGDMLTRIRNALSAGHKECVIYPASKMKIAILEILRKEGYIEGFSVEGRNISVRLRYDRKGRPAMSHLERVSKPSRRIYVSAREVPWVQNGLGIAIISTSKGLLTDYEARQKRLGGEVICEVW
ncbi:MAG: 30S ribosomal protein S8 [candidate division WOR-3 bacterium]